MPITSILREISYQAFEDEELISSLIDVLRGVLHLIKVVSYISFKNIYNASQAINKWS